MQGMTQQWSHKTDRQEPNTHASTHARAHKHTRTCERRLKQLWDATNEFQETDNDSRQTDDCLHLFSDSIERLGSSAAALTDGPTACCAVFILPSLTLHSSLCRRNCRRLNVSQLS